MAHAPSYLPAAIPPKEALEPEFPEGDEGELLDESEELEEDDDEELEDDELELGLEFGDDELEEEESGLPVAVNKTMVEVETPGALMLPLLC